MEKKTICFWFSCGVASAVALKKGYEKYHNEYNIIAVNTFIKQEHEDNQRFLLDVEKWVGIKIIHAGNRLFPDSDINTVFEKRKYVSGNKGAPCTMVLKKEARYQFEKENKIDFHVLGFTIDEKKRHDLFVRFERDNVLPILIDLELSKQDCFKIVLEAGIKPPFIYSLGFPNANCIGCVKSSSPTYWNLVRATFPEIFQERAELTRKLKCKLVKRKGVRIFLDELLPTDKGGKLKTAECGIFCELPKFLN